MGEGVRVIEESVGGSRGWGGMGWVRVGGSKGRRMGGQAESTPESYMEPALGAEHFFSSSPPRSTWSLCC